MEKKKYKKLKKPTPPPIESSIKATFEYQENPPRFINPYAYYCIHPNIFLIEEDRIVYSSPKVLRSMKKVSDIQVNYPFTGVITVNLRDEIFSPEVPHEYVIKKLRSLKNDQAPQWADHLESFPNDYPKKFTEVMSMLNGKKVAKKYAHAIMKGDEQNEKFLQGSAFWITTRYTKNYIAIESFTFTAQLLTYLEYDINCFIRYVFEYGIPLLYHNVTSLANLYGQAVFQNLFGLKLSKTKERKLELVNSKGNVISVVERYGSLIKKLNDDAIQAHHFHNFKTFQKTKHINEDLCVQSKLYFDIKETEPVNELLEKYYIEEEVISQPELVIIDDPRMCKFRMLIEDDIITKKEEVIEKKEEEVDSLGVKTEVSTDS